MSGLQIFILRLCFRVSITFFKLRYELSKYLFRIFGFFKLCTECVDSFFSKINSQKETGLSWTFFRRLRFLENQPMYQSISSFFFCVRETIKK